VSRISHHGPCAHHHGSACSGDHVDSFVSAHLDLSVFIVFFIVIIVVISLVSIAHVFRFTFYFIIFIIVATYIE
jgi:hypothetical protein